MPIRAPNNSFKPTPQRGGLTPAFGQGHETRVRERFGSYCEAIRGGGVGNPASVWLLVAACQ